MYKKQQHQEENYFMNLIPSKPQTTAPNYWCTWATQALTMTPETPTEIAFPGDQGLFGTRDNLNSRILFGEEGWARDWEGIRGDLIFLIDDGWDVPYLTRPQQQGFAFGSLIVDSVRFPECTGTPAERLKVLTRNRFSSRRKRWNTTGPSDSNGVVKPGFSSGKSTGANTQETWISAGK